MSVCLYVCMFHLSVVQAGVGCRSRRARTRAAGAVRLGSGGGCVSEPAGEALQLASPDHDAFQSHAYVHLADAMKKT